MAIEFISPEVDIYIGAVIVITIFAVMIYFISRIKMPRKDGSEPSRPARRSSWRRDKSEPGESEKKIETAIIKAEAAEVQGNLLDKPTRAADDYEEAVGEDIKDTISNLPMPTQNLYSTIQIAEQFFNREKQKMGREDYDLNVLLNAIKKLDWDIKKERQILVFELAEVDRLIYSITNYSARIEEGLKNYAKDNSDSFKKYYGEFGEKLKISKHLEKDLINKKKIILILIEKINGLLRLITDSKETKLVVENLKVKESIEYSIKQLDDLKENLKNIKEESITEFSEKVSKMVLLFLKITKDKANEVENLNNQLLRIAKNIEVDYSLLKTSFISSKNVAKDFKKATLNKEEKRRFDEIIRFDKQLRKKSIEKLEKVNEDKKTFGGLNKKVKAISKILEETINEYAAQFNRAVGGQIEDVGEDMKKIEEKILSIEKESIEKAEYQVAIALQEFSTKLDSAIKKQKEAIENLNGDIAEDLKKLEEELKISDYLQGTKEFFAEQAIKNGRLHEGYRESIEYIRSMVSDINAEDDNLEIIRKGWLGVKELYDILGIRIKKESEKLERVRTSKKKKEVQAYFRRWKVWKSLEGELKKIEVSIYGIIEISRGMQGNLTQLAKFEVRLDELRIDSAKLILQASKKLDQFIEYSRAPEFDARYVEDIKGYIVNIAYKMMESRIRTAQGFKGVNQFFLNLIEKESENIEMVEESLITSRNIGKREKKFFGKGAPGSDLFNEITQGQDYLVNIIQKLKKQVKSYVGSLYEQNKEVKRIIFKWE